MALVTEWLCQSKALAMLQAMSSSEQDFVQLLMQCNDFNAMLPTTPCCPKLHWAESTCSDLTVPGWHNLSAHKAKHCRLAATTRKRNCTFNLLSYQYTEEAQPVHHQILPTVNGTTDSCNFRTASLSD